MSHLPESLQAAFRPSETEERLELALHQLESTKRLYARLHHHNDEMEEEFLRLRSLLEGFRSQMQYHVKEQVRTLRSELSSVRDSVVFHTSGFQRDLDALERTLRVAISSGTVVRADMDVLYRSCGSGRVDQAAASSRGKGGAPASANVQLVSQSSAAPRQPPPVQAISSPPPKPGTARLRASHRAKQVRERRAAGDTNHLRNPLLREGPVQNGDSRKGGQQDSSIEFFSDAEGSGAERAVAAAQGTDGQRGPPANDGDEDKRPPAPVRSPPEVPRSGREELNVRQAAELAQQRATAERQAKELSRLHERLEKLAVENEKLQDRIRLQDENYQTHLVQLKQVHQEQEQTLRTHVDVLSAAINSRRQMAPLSPPPQSDIAAVGEGGATPPRDGAGGLSALPVTPPSSVLSKALAQSTYQTSLRPPQRAVESARKTKDDSKTAERDRQRRDLQRRRELAEKRAQAVLRARDAHHGSGFSPMPRDEFEVIADGLWAQRLLQQRSDSAQNRQQSVARGSSGEEPAQLPSRASSVHSGSSKRAPRSGYASAAGSSIGRAVHPQYAREVQRRSAQPLRAR